MYIYKNINIRHETPSIDRRSTCSLSLTHVSHYKIYIVYTYSIYSI